MPGETPSDVVKRRLSAWRVFGTAAVVVAFNVMAPTNAEINLPDLGDSSASTLSDLEERRLGRQLMVRIKRQLNIIDDLEINTYLEQLGHRLALNSGKPHRRYRWFIVNDPTLNAFASPGGNIGVHAGLINAAETESELASVLGHEIAHVTQRHIARMVARSKELSLPAAGAMIAAALLGGQAGAAAMVATNAAVMEDRLSYSRDFEREADALGMKTLNNAGFDPNGMIQFFGRMERWARVQQSDVPEFLRTHPLTTSRIAEAESRAARYPLKPEEKNPHYQVMRTRLRAQYAREPEDVLVLFGQRMLEHPSGIDHAIARYGEALAQIRLRDTGTAIATLTELSEAYPRIPAFGYALADALTAKGDYNAALKVMDGTQIGNGDLAESHMFIRKLKSVDILIRADQPREAYELTNSLLKSTRDNALLYERHARAAAEIGDPVASHIAMAEYHFLNDDHGAAIDQLFLAKNAVQDDFHAKSRIDARIAFIQNDKNLLEAN